MSGRDYFSGPLVTNGEENAVPSTPGVPAEMPGPPEPHRESSFIGRLKYFGTKKLVQKVEKDDVSPPPTTANDAEKEEYGEKGDEETPNGNGHPTKDTLYTFSDLLVSIRKTYENALNVPETDKLDQGSANSAAKLPLLENGHLRSVITPSTPVDTPFIRPSQDAIIIIAEQKVTVDGSMDLYRGTVGSVGNDIAQLESVAPGWLGELLLLVVLLGALQLTIG